MKRTHLTTILGFALLMMNIIRPAYSQQGYISAREFAESQAIAFQWFPIQRTLVLRKGTRIMHLTIDNPEARVDGQTFKLPSPPRIVDGQVMVPAHSLVNVFGSELDIKAPPVEPPGVSRPIVHGPNPEQAQDILQKPPQILQTPELQSGIVLVTSRHSRREDHTRVVLEFNGSVTYAPERQGKKFKLRINGCLNLVPTSRSNPAGQDKRDIESVSYNSGPDRQGLVISFDLPDGASDPIIETVGNPFRIVMSFPTPTAQAQAASRQSASATQPIAAIQTDTAPLQNLQLTAKTQPDTATSPAKVVIPEIEIEVPAASLTREAFLGRAVIIDPGHGGNDSGVTFPGLPPEKEITLKISMHLKDILKTMGFKAYLLRSDDIQLTPEDRRAAANKAGGDLLISIHAGGSRDELLEGVACYSFDPQGIQFETDDSSAAISSAQVYSDWIKTARFDLGKFLAQRINERMVKHLQADDRGVHSLPLLPLKFSLYPAVLVEVGVLTHRREGQKLASDKYCKAVAASIANGIVDFFNGIRL